MIHSSHKTLKTGISFIEVLVTLLLVSIVMSFAAPRFMASQQGRTKKQFFSEFGTLVADTLHQAIITKKVHQIFWNLSQHEIIVKIFDDKSDEKNKHAQFKPADQDTFKTKIHIPESLVIHNFFIQGKDEVKSGDTLNTVYTYIMPDGSSQQVLINISDSNETGNNRFSISINPFYSQASLHDTFKKP